MFEALSAARAIGDEKWRAEALAAVAPHLPPNLRDMALREALTTAQEIEYEGQRVEALAKLALFVKGASIIVAGDRSVAIGGDVSGSVITTGDRNVVSADEDDD